RSSAHAQVAGQRRGRGRADASCLHHSDDQPLPRCLRAQWREGKQLLQVISSYWGATAPKLEVPASLRQPGAALTALLNHTHQTSRQSQLAFPCRNEEPAPPPDEDGT
ncbi:unnamed protein product, partial [Pleuronectes platessa]